MISADHDAPPNRQAQPCFTPKRDELVDEGGYRPLPGPMAEPGLTGDEPGERGPGGGGALARLVWDSCTGIVLERPSTRAQFMAVREDCERVPKLSQRVSEHDRMDRLSQIPDLCSQTSTSPNTADAPPQARRTIKHAPWLTPEGISGQASIYQAASDLAGIADLDTMLCRASPPFLRHRPTRPCTSPSRGPCANIRRLLPRRRITTPSIGAISRPGRKSLSVAFDLATHRTRIRQRSSTPSPATSAWRAWRSIRSTTCARAVRRAFQLDQMSVSMTMNGAVLPVLALYIVAAGEQGVAPAKLSEGTIQRRHPQGSSWSATPTSIRPRHRCASSPTSSRSRPRTCRSSTSISISGYHMQEAGATGPRARLRARGRRRVRARRGSRRISPSTSSAPRLSFFWAIGM